MQKLTSRVLFSLGALFAFSSPNLMAEEAVTPTSPAVQTSTTQAVKQNVNVVNINTASAAELQDKLVNIGAKKAQAIVDFRDKNGKFTSIEQLTEVSGIGKATLEKNRERIIIE